MPRTSDAAHRIFGMSARRGDTPGPGRSGRWKQVRETKLLAACEILDNLACCTDAGDYFSEVDIESMAETYMVLTRAYQKWLDAQTS